MKPSRTKLDSKKLLQLVKQHPCLYDTNQAQYHSAVKKRQVWLVIGKEMGVPGPVCKTRWNNMRDTYRKSLYKKYKSGKNYRFKVPYGNDIEFLKEFFKPKLPRSKKSQAEDSSEMSDEEWDDKDEDSDECNTDHTTQVVCKIEKDNIEAEEESIDQEEEENFPLTEYAHVKDIKEVVEPVNPLVSEEHPVDAFLAGISPTLKSLSPYNLGLAKMEIFQVIHKYEMISVTPSGSSTITVKEQPSSSIFVDDQSE